MDSPGYGIAAMRRGSYDDAAAYLRPVSTDLPRQGLKNCHLLTSCTLFMWLCLQEKSGVFQPKH